ncbi:MAG: DinB family protein [Thermomicrobiales bacterium]
MDSDDLIQHYRTMRSALLAALEGLTAEQLTQTTLDGWSVKDHLNHIVFWDEMRAADMERISAGHDSAWHMTDDQAEALNGLAHPMRSRLSIAQTMWDLERTHRLIIEALDHATVVGLDPDRYAEPGLFSDHESEHTEWILAWRKRMGY